MIPLGSSALGFVERKACMKNPVVSDFSRRKNGEANRPAITPCHARPIFDKPRGETGSRPGRDNRMAA